MISTSEIESESAKEAELKSGVKPFYEKASLLFYITAKGVDRVPFK